MLIRWIQRAVLHIKEIQDAGLFALMADSRIFIAFNGSPLYFVMLPFLGFLLTVMAVINGYYLAKSANKNFDKWFGFITSAICALLASISLYGAALATAYEFSFAAGPWFFLSSVVLVSLHQMVMLGLNSYRAYESLKGSVQRMHYIQAIINNLFNLGLAAAITGSIFFVMLFPVAPVLGSAFALTAVALTLLNMAWRLLPSNWKQMIKNILFLGKPESLAHEETTQCPELISNLDKPLTGEEGYTRIFTRHDYSAEVKILGLIRGEEYLQNTITRKIASLSKSSLPETDQNQQKLGFLNEIAYSLSQHVKIRKGDLLHKYPLAFQSFWTEKSDAEHIYDAAKILIAQYEEYTLLNLPSAGHEPALSGI